MDTFFVSVERLLDPKLKGLPVIVGGNPFGRGVVTSCSYEARTYGVRSAMPIRKAYQLCPKGIYLRGNYRYYSEYSAKVTNLLAELVPLMQKSSVDEFYVDLSRCEGIRGPVYDWAQSIQRTIIGETELPVSLGLAVNKLVAKVATTQVAKKSVNRHHYVLPGEEAAFFAPLSIRALPGIGAKTEVFLREHNLKQLGQLASMPKEVMGRLLGKSGLSLVDRAKGIDNSPLYVEHDQVSYSRETTFSEDTLEIEKLFGVLLMLSSRLAADLRKAKKMAKTFSLKLRYSDFQTYSKAISWEYTNTDQAMYKLAKKLLISLWKPKSKVRLLGIEASNVIDDIEQYYIFEELGDEQTLCRAFDNIRAKHANAKNSGTLIRYAGSLAR